MFKGQKLVRLGWLVKMDTVENQCLKDNLKSINEFVSSSDINSMCAESVFLVAMSYHRT